GFKLARDAIEMIVHLAFCPIRIALRNGLVDRLVFAARPFGPTGLRKQRTANTFKVRSDRVEYFANAHQAQALGHLVMKPGVEFVEALGVAARDSGPLIGEVLTKARDRILRHAGRAYADNLDLQRTAHQHPLPDILEMNPGDIGAALRLDHDESFEREPVD